jgi:ribonuclease Y
MDNILKNTISPISTNLTSGLISNGLMSFLIIGLLGLVFGGVLGFLLRRYVDFIEKRRATSEAQEITEAAKDHLEMIEMDQKEELLQIEEELWSKAEKELLKTEEKIEDLEEILNEKKSLVEKEGKILQQKLAPRTTQVQDLQKTVEKNQNQLNILKTTLSDLQVQWTESLCKKLSSDKKYFTELLSDELIQESKIHAQQYLKFAEEELLFNLEPKAKKILATAIDRFTRPFCAERGLGMVEFPNENVRALLLEKERRNVIALQNICGCDLVIEEDNPMVGIAGFDPVRRELTRRTLEKILKDGASKAKQINPDSIQKRFDEAKRELIRQIKLDGDNLAKELKLEGLHPEIRQMMGALRYRYSFTQNQYFHCSEVGWLCGLLASELNIEIRKARRAGMLHDIGKSMDHAQEGGHAVIGADFIKARNEGAEIVHAVRAHHFDEQPSTDLAFLVIAADAISGARPGARRSTIESYNQKVEELENIAKSFKGVDEAYILSGGREVRIMTNGKQVDDTRALQLSRDIAIRIENEVNYPGQIKVVVVRSTVAQESTWVTA